MKILVATDGSRPAQAAVRFAAKLGASCRKADLVILTVSTLSTDLRLLFPADVRSLVPHRELVRVERASLRRRLDQASRGIRKESLKVRTHLLDPKTPAPLADTILREADREGADLIVVGSSGRGRFLDWALGSVAQYLVTHARTPAGGNRAAEPDSGKAEGGGLTAGRLVVAPSSTSSSPPRAFSVGEGRSQE